MSACRTLFLVALAAALAGSARADEIHKAAAAGDAATVAALLQANPTLVNAKDAVGWTPLHWAAATGQTATATLLIAHKGNPNAKDIANMTPLQWARQKEMIKLLRKSGAKLPQGSAGKVVRASEEFLRAIAAGNVEQAKDFLEANPDLANSFQESANRWSVLHEACTEGRTEIVALLLANQADPNVANKDGETPLLWAARKERLEIAALLLTHHADPSLADAKKQRTPLHEAAFRGHQEIVALLITHKANPNAKDATGKTPLFYALDNEHQEVAALLRRHGAK